MEKSITAECHNCESSYEINYVEEIVSQEYPEHCPFCGEIIEEITESSYIDEDDDFKDDEGWDD